MRKTIIGLSIGILLGYFFLPDLIHRWNLYHTSEDEVVKAKTTYHELANSLNRGVSSAEAEEKLHSIYLWFHVRGLPIDEGHGGLSKVTEWNEIIRYYQGH